MKSIAAVALTSFVVVAAGACHKASADAPAGGEAAAGAVIDHTVTDIDGNAVDLKSYRGKALLIVNVASECGYTPQYAELQVLQDKYKDRGLVVIGFPSNDFGGQEPKEGAEIKKFAQTEYGVSFPLMAKVHATGDEAAPVYKTLTSDVKPDLRGPVKWNFTKFLVDPQGQVVARFPSDVSPDAPQLAAAIESALPQKS
jgi:glutathione peroxidase